MRYHILIKCCCWFLCLLALTACNNKTSQWSSLLSKGEIDGYTFVGKDNCDYINESKCTLNYKGKFMLNVNTDRQTVAYKLSYKVENGNEVSKHGQLSNCVIISINDFKCEEITNNEGNLSLSYKLDLATDEVKINKVVGDFNEYDELSDSFLVRVASYLDLLNYKDKEFIENYGVAICILFAIGLIIFIAEIS